MDFRISQLVAPPRALPLALLVAPPRALLLALLIAPALWLCACSEALPARPSGAGAPPGSALARYVRDAYPLLESRCLDCHHSQVAVPWYAAVPWVGTMVRRDVAQGRQHLDLALPFPFVPDGAEEEVAPRGLLFGLRAAILDGSMPPRRYLLAHPGARLDADERAALVAWLDAALAELPRPDEDATDPERVHTLLRERCARCHRSGVEEDLNGGFDFAADIAWLAEDEDYIVAEEPEESLLFERLTDPEDPMPPSPEDVLSEAEIELLRRWIADGAEAPE